MLLADSSRLLRDPGTRHDVRRILDKVPADTRLVLFAASGCSRPRESITALVQGGATALIDPPLRSSSCQCSPDSLAASSGNPHQAAGGCRSPSPHDQVVDLDLLLKATAHRYLRVDEEDKSARLVGMLDTLDFQQVAVFAKSADRAEAVGKVLADHVGVSVVVIHEGLDRDEQSLRYGKFKNYQARVLVATDLDLFSRGVDVKRVNVIINYDVPSETLAYSRRAGHVRGANPKDAAMTLVAGDQDMADLLKVRQRFGVSLEEVFSQAVAAPSCQPCA